jgi:hypothetical protein
MGGGPVLEEVTVLKGEGRQDITERLLEKGLNMARLRTSVTGYDGQGTRTDRSPLNCLSVI